MGNCCRRTESADKIEVIPPSEHQMSLPKFKDIHQFKVPKIIQQKSVKACFRKNLTPIDIHPQENTVMTTTESE